MGKSTNAENEMTCIDAIDLRNLAQCSSERMFGPPRSYNILPLIHSINSQGIPTGFYLGPCCMYVYKCSWYRDVGGLRNQLHGYDFAFHCELLLACPPARVKSCGCTYDWICLSLYCPFQRKTKSVLCPRELVKFEAHRLAHAMPTGSRHQPNFETCWLASRAWTRGGGRDVGQGP